MVPKNYTPVIVAILYFNTKAIVIKIYHSYFHLFIFLTYKAEA